MKACTSREREPEHDVLTLESKEHAALRRRLCSAGKALVKNCAPDPLEPTVHICAGCRYQNIRIERAAMRDPEGRKRLAEQILPMLAARFSANAVGLFEEVDRRLRVSFVTAETAQSLEAEIRRDANDRALLGPFMPVTNGSDLLLPAHIALYGLSWEHPEPQNRDRWIEKIVRPTENGYIITLNSLLAHVV
jgi:hypothetical protein